jgi:hypothetical protein
MFEVFRVNITILRQKIIFYPIPEGSANIFGVFCAPGAPPPPLDPPLYTVAIIDSVHQITERMLQ